MLRFLGIVLLLLLGFNEQSSASQPCRENPCSTGTCYDKAAWVIDGTLASIGNETSERASTVKISDVTVIKGAPRIADRSALFYVGSYCYSPQFSRKRQGTKYRIYGTGENTIIDFENLEEVFARDIFLEKKQKFYSELGRLSSDTCQSDSDEKLSGEKLFNRGKAFFELTRYPEARSCFFRALAYREESSSYKAACYYIGLMYETGAGFEKDLEIAKGWIKEAGY